MTETVIAKLSAWLGFKVDDKSLLKFKLGITGATTALLKFTNDTVKAIVIGRTDKSCNMSIEKWKALLSDKPYLKDKPIVINADFGHTTPIITFPIGGKCKVSVNSEGCRLTLFKEAGD